MAVGGSSLRFRPLRRRDYALLSQWLAAPHVWTWWREGFDLAAIEARYGPSIDGADPTECFMVLLDDGPVGFVQRYLLRDNPQWQRALAVAGTPDDGAGIDYLIGVEDLVGQGLGPDIIGRFVADTWTRYSDVTAIVVDVDIENRRSWRALEKAGFVRVWSGLLESDDPSDNGPNHVYLRLRDPT